MSIHHPNTGDDPSLPGGYLRRPLPDQQQAQPKYREPRQLELPLRRATGRRKANSPREAAMMILGEL